MIFLLLRNHFYPTFKLDDKIMIKTRHKRIHEKPVTPYQRVLDSKYINQETKDNLTTIQNKLDPIDLQINIQKKLKTVFDKLKHSSNLLQFRTPVHNSLDNINYEAIGL